MDDSQLLEALEQVWAVADKIREAGSVPSSTLGCSLPQYDMRIALLIREGLVSVSRDGDSHTLHWNGE